VESLCKTACINPKKITCFALRKYPVILSKTQIETCQTCAAVKPLNATVSHSIVWLWRALPRGWRFVIDRDWPMQ
jgi:hypothetical protein